jgi:Cupin superfamily protein
MNMSACNYGNPRARVCRARITQGTPRQTRQHTEPTKSCRAIIDSRSLESHLDSPLPQSFLEPLEVHQKHPWSSSWTKEFLQDVWGQRACLIRGAFSDGWTSPISSDVLAGMACEEDELDSRIVVQVRNHHRCAGHCPSC